MAGHPKRKSTAQKIAVFRQCFTGLRNVYGTYDPCSGRARQVKQRVTDEVILAHLCGRQPYGVYLLVGELTRAVAADFDAQAPWPPIEFIRQADHYGIKAYLERSKRKGWHAWVFMDPAVVPAAKARLVIKHILDDISRSATEVFPKQDRLIGDTCYGNFINAPLFGALVPKGRTVFVDPNDPSKPHPNQWALLERVERVSERILDDVIEVNEIEYPAVRAANVVSEGAEHNVASTCGLPICAQRMLAHGVRDNQRVSCFRLAVALKRTGLPVDMALAVLRTWACRNRPADGKRIITPLEIESQAECAYHGRYRSYGCEDPVIQAYCDPVCPLRRRATRGSSTWHEPTHAPRRSTAATPATDTDGAPRAAERQSEPESARRDKMTEHTPQRPVKEFRAGTIRAAIWRNEILGDDGETTTRYSVRVEKTFRDSRSEQWRQTDYFFTDELPQLRLVADKAYEFIALREREPDSESEPTSANPDEFPNP